MSYKVGLVHITNWKCQCMYVCTPYFFLTKSTYLESKKIVIAELQLYPINHKTRIGSWNLVIMRDTSTHTTHIFWEKVCHSILKQCHFAILTHSFSMYLAHSFPMHPFCTRWKHLKTFLMFSEGREMMHCKIWVKVFIPKYLIVFRAILCW